MINKKLQELIKIRKQLAKSIEKNEVDLLTLLTGQYNDPSHFIYEILQNAEDAGAKTISFSLHEDRLEINHNGKDFDYNDIKGITGIGYSTKKEDINAIGKFGVGFKSVFAITETPRIYSGQNNFEIQDFLVQKFLKKIPRNNNTKIILPFNHRTRNTDLVYSIIEKKFENIGLISILFLSNIQSIEWNTKSKGGQYFKKLKNISKLKNVKRVEIFSNTDGIENIEKYIVIHKNVKINKKALKVEIAYKIGKNKDGNETIVPLEDSKLVVFFPTEKITFLNFLIQGPFRTTPNRENIPLDDDQNGQLIDGITELAAESLSIIKKLNLLNVDFLQILPLNQFHSTDIIYSKIFKRIRREFLIGEDLLPTTRSGYTKPEHALLARGKGLVNFLNKSDINFLFCKNNWLDSGITYDRTDKLRSYLLDELDIEEISFSDFAEKISKEFLERKSDNWMADFYAILLDQKNLWEKTNYNSGLLRKKPIIRLSNGDHISPFDENGHIQVYFPSESTTHFKTVKDIFLKKKKSFEFLKQLGLSKPDIYSEIKEFILPKYLDTDVNVNKEYYQDFKKIFEVYKKISDDKKSELINTIKGLPIISCIYNGNKKLSLKNPCDIYLDTLDLLEYFNGFDDVFFVDEKLYDYIDQPNFTDFLIEIGVNDSPRRIPFEANLELSKKNDLLQGSNRSYDISEIDYEYESLAHFLKNFSFHKSLLLWTMLLKSMENFKSKNNSNFFNGRYTWHYRRSDDYAEFESKFLKTLKNTSWLYTINDEEKKPVEISNLDLKKGYSFTNKNSEKLIYALGFIPDPVKQYTERTGSKLISNEEYEEYQILKAEKDSIEEKEIDNDFAEEDEWEPEVEVDQLEPIVEEADLTYIPIVGLNHQGSENIVDKSLNNEGISQKDIENNAQKKSPKFLKKIGRWGEEYVYQSLVERYKDFEKFEETDSGFKSYFAEGYIFEIKWLNKSSETGRGCDLLILRNDLAIEYIEVKSKKDGKDELIEITGTQWEFARQLYNEGNGDKYYIYVVQNAGKSNSKIKIIQNPINLWYSGKLYAHPVNIKI